MQSLHERQHRHLQHVVQAERRKLERSRLFLFLGMHPAHLDTTVRRRKGSVQIRSWAHFALGSNRVTRRSPLQSSIAKPSTRNFACWIASASPAQTSGVWLMICPLCPIKYARYCSIRSLHRRMIHGTPFARRHLLGPQNCSGVGPVPDSDWKKSAFDKLAIEAVLLPLLEDMINRMFSELDCHLSTCPGYPGSAFAFTQFDFPSPTSALRQLNDGVFYSLVFHANPSARERRGT
jgi:hypothetical protein